MKFFSFLTVICVTQSQTLLADLDGIEVQREDSLFLRRVEEYWREGEKKIVKVEIEKYLQEKPTSHLTGFLQGLLGDLCCTDQDFIAAESHYEKITDPLVKKRVFLSILRCLYEEKKYGLVLEKSKGQAEFESFPSFLWIVGDSAYRLAEESQNKEQYLLAKSYFEKLSSKENYKEAMVRIGQIYEKLKEMPAAVQAYLTLAEKMQGNDQELFLFLAAQNQASYDPIQAIATFDRIVKMNQSKAQEAAYNKLILQYDKEQYAELIKEAESTLSTLAQEKSSLVRYLVAKSYFKMKNYPEAVKQLKSFLNVYQKKDDWMLSSLRILAASAQILKDEEIFSLALRHYISYFPLEKDVARVLLARAVFYKNNQKFSEALADFETLHKNYPSFQDPLLTFEEGHLFYCTKKYPECIQALTSLLSTTDEKMKGKITRCLMQCHHHLMKEGNLASKEKFCELIKQVLEKKDFASDEENMNITLTLASYNIEEGLLDEAISLLKGLLEKSPLKEKMGQTYLLLAQASFKKDKDFSNYVEIASKAFKMKDIPSSTVHLALFNAMLSLADDKKMVPDDAAEHLYEASKETVILDENLLWLADYYYGKWLTLKDQESEKRAKTFYEKILFDKEGKKLLLDTFPDREECFYLWINLLKNGSDREAALVKITELYDQKKEGWKLQAKGYFLLGCTYLESKEDAKALAAFKKVGESTLNAEEKALSKLYEVRLELAKVSQEELTSKSDKVLGFLKDLKNLKLLKNLDTEPAHLEAALDYIDLQMKIDPTKTLKDRLTLLQETKDYFLQEEDMLSKEYQSQRKKQTDKNRLVENYLTFFEGEIDLIKSSLEKNLRYREGAIERFQTLEKSGLSSKFLKERVALRLNDFKTTAHAHE